MSDTTTTNYVFKKIGKYLRELSVVVIGVAITFTLSDWISSRNEQKDLRRNLEMVKMELEDNLEIVQELFDFYDRTGKFAKYLYACGKQENIQADSLAKYDYIMKRVRYFGYQQSAFDMLKSSGTMRIIKDKALLKSIMDCYRLMEYAKNVGDSEMAIKNNELRNSIRENGISNDIFELSRPKYKQLFYYFAIHTGSEGLFRESKEQIEKTLEMFPEETK